MRFWRRRDLSRRIIRLSRQIKKADLLIVALPLLYPEDVWSALEKQRYVALLEMLNGKLT